jgi:hypothetical protein
MSLTLAQQNVVSELQTMASEVVRTKYRMIALVQMYVNESIGSLTTDDLHWYADFAHLTAAELQDAAAALAAINTTIGDFGAASNAAKLLKIVKAVPK